MPACTTSMIEHLPTRSLGKDRQEIEYFLGRRKLRIARITEDVVPLHSIATAAPPHGTLTAALFSYELRTMRRGLCGSSRS